MLVLNTMFDHFSLGKHVYQFHWEANTGIHLQIEFSIFFFILMAFYCLVIKRENFGRQRYKQQNPTNMQIQMTACFIFLSLSRFF